MSPPDPGISVREFTNEITQAIGRAIERVVYDGADPKASLDQAQAEVEKVLKK